MRTHILIVFLLLISALSANAFSVKLESKTISKEDQKRANSARDNTEAPMSFVGEATKSSLESHSSPSSSGTFVNIPGSSQSTVPNPSATSSNSPDKMFKCYFTCDKGNEVMAVVSAKDKDDAKRKLFEGLESNYCEKTSRPLIGATYQCFQK